MRQRLLAVLAALVLVAAGAPGARATGNDLTGRRAPDLYVPQAIQGVQPGTTLATYAGKVLVLKFFFAGCPTCRASLPEFQRLSVQYAGRPEVQFLALAYDTYENVAPLVRANGYTFPIGLDPTGDTPKRYGVHTYPTEYVIGGDGVVKAYDTLSTWAIDRAAATAAPVAPAVSPEVLRERRIAELGEVPPALAAAKDAAGARDYGQVLRVVEAHLDPAKDAPAVVTAAKRIQALALERYYARARRIIEVWNVDRAAAWQAVDVFQADFRGTSKEASTAEWIATLGPRTTPAR